jgi:hypothetical protein
MSSANDTLLDTPIARPPSSGAVRDRTPDLARIVRHALLAASPAGPLDRAIRAAARRSGPIPTGGEEVDDCALGLARQLADLLYAEAPLPPADPRCETVRN